MATFSLSSIVGKPLTARTAVKLYREASDTAKPYASIAAGNYMGNLYSWINPGPRTKNLWLMFYDSNNKPYYVKYTSNTVNSAELQKQGVKTVDQETREKEDQQNREQKGAVQYYIEKYVPWIIAGFIAVPVLKELTKSNYARTAY